MGLSRKKLETFLKRQLTTGSEDNPVCRITLRHAMGGNRAAVVKDMEVTPMETAVDLATQFEEAANDDAEGLGGVQSYVISSYFTSHPDKVRERLSFKLARESEDDDTVDQTEGATERGLLQQLMRHNEANARVMTMGMGEVVRQQNRMIERQALHIETLMDKHMNVLELQESMMTAKGARDIEILKTTSKISREDAAIEKFMEFIPVILNRLGGKAKMLAEEASPAEMMLTNFAKTLQPEQLEQMGKILSPEQSLAMIELISLQQEREEAKKKKVAEAEKKVKKLTADAEVITPEPVETKK